MEKFSGTVISDGIAIGKATKFFQVLSNNLNNILDNTKENQLKILNEAIYKLQNNLIKIYEHYNSIQENKYAELINIQIILLEDVEFYGEIIRNIEEGKTAIDAIKIISEKLITDFNAINDNYFSQRAKDIDDLATQLIEIINSLEKSINLYNESVIIAEDISINKLLELPKNKISAIILTKGSINSHLSILLRMLEIPAIICNDENILKIDKEKNIIVDCKNSEIIVGIDNGNYSKIKEEINNRILIKKQLLDKYKSKETITRNGKKIHLFANIGTVEDADFAVLSDAEGVGLLRTEFICNNKNNYPTEKEQEEIYFNIVKKLKGKPIIIRTFDFGSDKKVDFIKFSKEKNPALGMRAIRLCLQNTDLFLTQLKAIYKAAIKANEIFPNPISIMFPMIVSIWEIDNCVRMCRNIETELNINFKVNLGIMIETPAAVLIADKLAKYVDFFSVGTNDLIQYTYAMDRLSNELNSYFQQLDYLPIYEMLKIISTAAKNNNINLGICGEMAADKNFTQFFIEMGFTEFSVNPNKILEMRKTICEL